MQLHEQIPAHNAESTQHKAELPWLPAHPPIPSAEPLLRRFRRSSAWGQVCGSHSLGSMSSPTR